jgi:hypothetical protein
MPQTLTISCNVGGLFPAHELDAETYSGVTDSEIQRIREWTAAFLSPVEDAAELPDLVTLHLQELGGTSLPPSPVLPPAWAHQGRGRALADASAWQGRWPKTQQFCVAKAVS